MKGIAGKQTRGAMTGTILDVADNSGAKTINLIAVPGYHGAVRRQPSASVGDIIVASVKKGNPEMRRQVVYAIIVRQTSIPSLGRNDGHVRGQRRGHHHRRRRDQGN